MPEIALADKHYAEAKRLLANCDTIELAIDKCERCNQDTGDRRERIEIARHFLRNLIKEWFPDRL